mmetsp:Transcript_10843/g.30471  ORF Transcript_10843/g.30471 Transcript_10843/m.30471 type:complete len:95 (+) Transcript_10843:805-1089(+)
MGVFMGLQLQPTYFLLAQQAFVQNVNKLSARRCCALQTKPLLQFSQIRDSHSIEGKSARFGFVALVDPQSKSHDELTFGSAGAETYSLQLIFKL